jgi:hypothetical protein
LLAEQLTKETVQPDQKYQVPLALLRYYYIRRIVKYIKAGPLLDTFLKASLLLPRLALPTSLASISQYTLYSSLG